MRTCLTLVCALAVFVLAPPATFGQQAASKIDVKRLGPQVGQPVPDFHLQDQHGKIWTRDSLMGRNGAMLVFSRSADWCPYCKTQMIDLQRRLPELTAQGLGMAVITYDSPAVLADFSARRAITFPLLSDAESRTIRKFGVLNTTVDEHSSSYGIPFPSTFIINRQGVVTARFFEDAYQERNTVSTILLKLGRGKPTTNAQRITTDHVEITTYLTDDVVAPGSLFSIVLSITPRERIHVYAPGAQGYKIVTLDVEPQPLLTTKALEYPPSEVYFFKPLNERVPVFQKPFTLTQTMALGTSREAQAALANTETVTIRGTLNYQACDDKVCFTPKAVPVSYKVKVRALDTERAKVLKR